MNTEQSWYAQTPYRCRLEWGRDGARRAAARGDMLVVVDTLSFSTAVATAIHHGGSIYPCARNETPAEVAARIGGEAAVHRNHCPAQGRFSLSPVTFIGMQPGTIVVLGSPNGATCSRYARDIPYLCAGALVNARAVGRAITALLRQHNRQVTVVAAGERWDAPGEDGALRMAVEDYLGAGAIIAHIAADKSPEADICEGAFHAARSRLPELLLACGSGRELVDRGWRKDVEHAAHLDLYDSVPVMHKDMFQAMPESQR